MGDGEGVEFIEGDVGHAKYQGLVAPVVVTGFLGTLLARLTGGALSGVVGVLKSNAGAIAALGLDAAAAYAAYAHEGKGGAILAVAAIVASMAFLPRIAFSVEPPPIK